MLDCVKCPFCPDPVEATLAGSYEVARVPAIVREFQRELFTVWRCGSCDSLHSKEAVDLDAYYRVYPLAGQSEDYLTRQFCRTRLEALKRAGMKKSDAILDFGCGTGLFVSYLTQKGYAKAVGHDPYISIFSGPEVLAKKYDVILAQDVIEHADDPRVMMKTLVGCLKPGGLICLGTPCAERISLKPYEAFAVSLHQPYHRHIFSTRALVQLAREEGLTLSHLRKRHVGESARPGANLRFLHDFVRHSGNVINAGFEPPAPGLFRRHPLLIAQAFLGYFFSRKSEMALYFNLRESEKV